MRKYFKGLCLLIMMSLTVGSYASPNATEKNVKEVSEVSISSHLTDVPQPVVADLNYSLPVPDENAVKPLLVVNLLSYDSLAANAPISPQLLSPVKYNIAVKNKNAPDVNYGNSYLTKYGGWCSPKFNAINI